MVMKSNLSKLKSTLDEIGKCEFHIDSNLKDYLYNGEEVNNVKEDYYSKLKKLFIDKLNIQLIERKADKKLLEDLEIKSRGYFDNLKDRKGVLRGSYLFSKNKGELRESSDWTHDRIMAIMRTQLECVKSIHSRLCKLHKELDYLVEEDFDKLRINFNTKPDENEVISLNKFGKTTVTLTKKDTISFFLILENLGYLDFSKTDRNKFIENYFEYQDNKDKSKSLVNINADISNLIEGTHLKSRNKNSTKKFIKNLQNSLEDFDFERFTRSLRR
jgi:hypothetical protein